VLVRSKRPNRWKQNEKSTEDDLPPHRIAHIQNRDILVPTIAAGIAAAVTCVAHATQFAALFGGHGRDGEGRGSLAGSLLLAVAAPIVATLIQLGISRSREYLADETGARLTGDPLALAQALGKLAAGVMRIPAEVEPATASLFIVSPFVGHGGFASFFSTHPPVEERIRRLAAMARNPRAGVA
jgi:heat shock protein HtpX